MLLKNTKIETYDPPISNVSPTLESFRGQRNQDDQQRWSALLGSILHKFCKGESVVWAIALDESVEVRLGLPIQGTDFVRMQLRDGKVSIHPLPAPMLNALRNSAVISTWASRTRQSL